MLSHLNRKYKIKLHQKTQKTLENKKTVKEMKRICKKDKSKKL